MTAADTQRTTPVEIRKERGERLRILWADQHLSAYEAHRLRALCPCALCVDEITGERRVGAREVAADVSMRAARPVGNYAIQIDWSDGHVTGLYSFAYLRAHCDCEVCSTA